MRTTNKRSKRLNVLTVPMDIVHEEDLEDRIHGLLADKKRHHIVLTSLWDFVRARGNGAYARTVRSASLVIPTSRALVWAAKFLRGESVPRYMPFDFIIKVLGILERKNGSVYLFGGRPGALHTAASNLRASFPNLRVVGRCAGFYRASDESNIILAVRKASPSLLLAGTGVPGKGKWILTHRDELANGLFYWCGDCIEVFSGRKKRTSRRLWESKLGFVPFALRRPWRVYRLLPYLWFLMALCYHRIKKL